MTVTAQYSIKTIAEKTGLKISTLHYYEKIGLMPTIVRGENGHRIFTDQHVEWVNFLKAMKKSGMPLEAIRQFANHHKQGGSLKARLTILQEHQARMAKQMNELQSAIDFIDKKVAMFEEAIETYPNEA